MKLYRVYTMNASTAPSRHQSLEAIHSMTCDRLTYSRGCYRLYNISQAFVKKISMCVTTGPRRSTPPIPSDKASRLVIFK